MKFRISSLIICIFFAINFYGAVPPQNVTISKVGDIVSISWDKAEGAEKYYIYKGYLPYSEMVKIDSTTSLSYNDSETSYKCFYQVQTSDRFSVEMVHVTGGTYLMGDHYRDGYNDEWPVHEVTVNNFYIQPWEVTQKEWTDIMGSDFCTTSWSSVWGVGNNYPAYGMSWYDTIVYCNKRSIKDGLTPVYNILNSTNPNDWGVIPTTSNTNWNAAKCNWNANGYRLLTEAEWEYAARGGENWTNNYKFSGCLDDWNLRNYATFESGKFSEVTTKLPNQLELYGMSGNVIEFCWDVINTFTFDKSKNPVGPIGELRLRRGGARYSEAKGVRVTNRASYNPSSRYTGGEIGVRIGSSDVTQEFDAVTINYPDSAEIFKLGTITNIRWIDNFSENISIELYKSNVYYSTITASAPSTGLFSWSIPTYLTPGSDYKIKITSSFKSNVYDISDFSFTLTDDPVNVYNITSPSMNPIWMKNRKYAIGWHSTLGSDLRIDLLRNGLVYSNIQETTQNDGVFEWLIPDSIENDTTYQIKLTSSLKESLWTISDFFTVEDNLLQGLIFVEGGTFQMGDVLSEGEYKENPVHNVTLSNFYMGENEVTQKEWILMIGSNPSISSFGIGDEIPVNNVSWYATLVYCNKKSISEGLNPCYSISNSTNPDDWGTVPTSANGTWNAVVCNWSANGYRLPTEAEWEYAARGGIYYTDNFRYSGFNEAAEMEKFCWGIENTNCLKEVASLKPNKLGIYDMNGNAWEWCWDWYDYYSSATQTNPTGPIGNSWKVQRGGSFANYTESFRVSARDFLSQCFYINLTGFRIVRRFDPEGITLDGNDSYDFSLKQNYPNPFNPVTTISYALPSAAQVEIEIYNLHGQIVQLLVNGKMDKGKHKAEFNGADLTSGMYIYNLKVDNKVVSSKKMMLLK